MKTLIRILGLIALLAGASAAQTALTSTTLTREVLTSDQSIAVASASGISASSGGASSGSFLVLGRETMRVLGVNGLNVRVERGYVGGVFAHPSGAVVYEATAGELASSEPYGACDIGEKWPYTPLIVPGTGNLWTCTNGLWKKSDGTRFSSDCDALTDGQAGDICVESSTFVAYVCAPSSGLCDSAAEWYQVNGGNAQDEADLVSGTVLYRQKFGETANSSVTARASEVNFAAETLDSGSTAQVGNHYYTKFTHTGTEAGYTKDLTGMKNYAYLYGDGSLGGKFRGSADYAYLYGGTTFWVNGNESGSVVYGGTTTEARAFAASCYSYALQEGVNTAVENCVNYWAYKAYVRSTGDQTAELTNRYGFYAEGTATVTGNATLGANYGFYAEAHTGGTVNFNFYSAGATSKNFFEGLVQAGRLELLNGTEGTCDADHRGEVVLVEGGAGVADTARMCVKDAGDSYAWTTIL